MERMPEPQPTSRNVRSTFSAARASIASRHARVVGCWPVPNAMPGSSVSTFWPGAGVTASHGGRTTSLGEITSVLKCLR